RQATQGWQGNDRLRFRIEVAGMARPGQRRKNFHITKIPQANRKVMLPRAARIRVWECSKTKAPLGCLCWNELPCLTETAVRQEESLFCCFLAGTNQLFLDAGSLAGTVAQVVELRATNVAATLDFDAGNLRRVKLEGTFHRFTGRDLANDERRVQTTIAAANDHAFVSLHTLAVAFNHVDVDHDGVAGAEFGQRLTTGQALDFFL